MKIWKVIFATLVIFAAGALAGGMFVRSITPPATPATGPTMANAPQQFFQARLKKELQLTADQTNRLDKVFVESNARRKTIISLIDPELKKERQEVHDEIRAILTAEQREKFEQLLKQPPPHRPVGRGRPRSGTNMTNAATMPGK